MTTSITQRYTALDVLRGMTIAGMILVNNPGPGVKYFHLLNMQNGQVVHYRLGFPILSRLLWEQHFRFHLLNIMTN
jgi:predicted acyltransferase